MIVYVYKNMLRFTTASKNCWNFLCTSEVSFLRRVSTRHYRNVSMVHWYVIRQHHSQNRMKRTLLIQYNYTLYPTKLHISSTHSHRHKRACIENKTTRSNKYKTSPHVNIFQTKNILIGNKWFGMYVRVWLYKEEMPKRGLLLYCRHQPAASVECVTWNNRKPATTRRGNKLVAFDGDPLLRDQGCRGIPTVSWTRARAQFER